MAKKNVLTHAKKQQALTLMQQGNPAGAKPLLEKVCRADRSDSEALFLLGIANGMLGQHAEAESAFRRILKLFPEHPDANNNLGLSLEAQGKSKESVEFFQKALQASPENPLFHFNLANSLESIDQFEEAIGHYRKAISLEPDNHDLYINLGHALLNNKDTEGAEAVYRRAIELNQNSFEAYNGLGNVLKNKDFTAAEEAYQKALQLQPNYATAYINLANLQLEQGRLDEAMTSFGRAQACFEHESYSDLSNILFALNYLSHHTPQIIYEKHLEYAHKLPSAEETLQRKPTDAQIQSRIRLGYLSPDFRRHSVAFFIEPILAHHDHDKFEVFCYANVRECDSVTERLKQYADHWRDIHGIADEEVVKQVRDDGIDILVDLAGHTAGNRLPVFAHKPAPIQVTYLGYPNTTGLSMIDYRLTDAWADPPGQENFYTEQLLRLENGFLCYRPATDVPDVGPLPVLGQGHITFGSFNNLAKTGNQVIAVWARILNALPGSQLLLKYNGLHDAGTRARIRALFAEQGINQEQVRLIGWLENPAEHMELYNQIDIALDTFPYNGTTTTCEALWMGVPVLTLAGQQHAGRVGVSILQQAGLTDWIASDEIDYVERAVGFAKNTQTLSVLRQDMRKHLSASPLLSEADFTTAIEAAYLDMLKSEPVRTNG